MRNPSKFKLKNLRRKYSAHNKRANITGIGPKRRRVWGGNFKIE